MSKLASISPAESLTLEARVREPDLESPPAKDMVWIPGGTFRMGSDRHYPEEAPVHDATVAAFWMDKYPVTNTDFKRFADAESYVTVAERVPDASFYPCALPHMLVAGSVVFRQPTLRVDLRNYHHWWTYLPGADWRRPEGPASTLQGREDHPVVHVAYEDIEAYTHWAGKEIPTEAEWEFAARGGLESAVYAWGNEFAPGGMMMANVWQGEFPLQNLLVDGFEWTSPAGAFPANGYGLYDMTGNVWEWTCDWFQQRWAAKACCSGNAKNDAREKSCDPRTPEIHIPRKVLKGGSYLCAANYCLRYRPAARIAQQVDTGTCHQGFRCIMRTKSNLDSPGERF